MSSAFERLQKLAEEKRLKEKAEKPLLEIVPANTEELPSAPSAGSRPSAPRLVSAPSAGKNKLPISPEKDFTKVANSIVREIPNGVFIGKSKQMYDYLYSLSRGAIKPTRSVRISKSSLMRGSGIRSTHTFYNNLRHLETIGLIAITRIDGEKGGNSYEVFVPEEIKNDLAHLAHLAQAGQLAQLGQKLPVAVSAESALTALGSNAINTYVYTESKTSFKDNIKNDDEARLNEAFSAMTKRLDAAAKKLTGKGVSKNEIEKWGNLADLLILEMEAAASRTGTISSVPAFLTEVLRRKLLGGNSQPRSAKSTKVRADTVGKPNAEGEYEKKPLDKEGREAALLELRDFAGDDFLQDFRKWYTKEDWAWLTEELNKIKSDEDKTKNSKQI